MLQVAKATGLMGFDGETVRLSKPASRIVSKNGPRMMVEGLFPREPKYSLNKEYIP